MRIEPGNFSSCHSAKKGKIYKNVLSVNSELFLKRTVECVENFTYTSGSCVPRPERGYKIGNGNHACVILPGK